ncbi:MAG: hypothetical protein HZB41_12210 [Ignavibacteriae bacterium]|nr:hypothetical protein [Ignavibacteriota bacterium]
MRNIFILIIALIFISCEQSEVHDKYQPILYNYILTNQTKSVIMPLHIGNRWIYQVSDFNSKGDLINSGYDTIYVVKDTLIGYERWFNVKWINYNNLRIITNTDIGLSDKYSICGGYSNNEVFYPAYYSSYLICKYENFRYLVPPPYNDTIGDFVTVSAYYWCDIESNKIINVNAGSYNCYQYTLWTEIICKYFNFANTIICRYYYTPDIGLIRFELYNYDSMYKVYDLISYKLYE